MRTVGVFGGMFDPPHLGHVAVARAAPAALGLDVLLVTVARSPAHRDAPVAPAADRLDMARAAFSGLPRVEVSDLELRRAGPTYTVDTLEALVDEEPASRIVLVLGADAAASLGSWHRAGDVARLAEVAIVPRPGADAPAPEGFRWRVLEMTPVDLSSTAVREALGRGEDPSRLVPREIVPLLAARRLYSR